MAWTMTVDELRKRLDGIDGSYFVRGFRSRDDDAISIVATNDPFYRNGLTRKLMEVEEDVENASPAWDLYDCQ